MAILLSRTLAPKGGGRWKLEVVSSDRQPEGAFEPLPKYFEATNWMRELHGHVAVQAIAGRDVNVGRIVVPLMSAFC